MTNATILPRPAVPRGARLARMAAPLLVAALAACGDGGGPIESTEPGSIRFAYGGSWPQGQVSGTYQAEGDPSFAGPQITQTFALGQRVAGQTTLRVLSNLARNTQQQADFAIVTIPRLTVGRVDIAGTCPGETCAAVSLALEVSTNVAVSQARYSCALEAGSIRITSITGTRAQGTFEGTGSCIGRPGTADLDQFSITGGTFDVNVINVPS